MLTQCPSCQTMFRITQDILRVADGQVRCGRCHTQFDALARLIQEEPAEEIELEGDGPADGPDEEDTLATADVADTEDADFTEDQLMEDGSAALREPADPERIAVENDALELTGEHRAFAQDIGTPGPGTHAGLQDPEALTQDSAEEWAEIDDIDAVEAAAHAPPAEEIELSAEYDADTEAEEDARALAEAERLAAARTSPAPTSVAPGAALRRHKAADHALAEDEAALDLLSPRTARKRPSVVWSVLVVPLLVLLVAQVVHHHRGELARHPRIGEPLMRAYGVLGLSLTPEWNLHAYEIRQWGVVADPAAPGTLRVRASIANRAEFPQPYPLLKLMLEDRWGELVRAREFEPGEYLDPSISPDRLLAPQQQANASIVIVDPGPDAEGFRFDVCLHGAHGPVCATDLPPTR